MTRARWQVAMVLHVLSLILMFLARTDLTVASFGPPLAKTLFYVGGFGVILLLPFSLGSLVFTMGYKFCVGSALYDRVLRQRIAEKWPETYLVWPEVQQLYRDKEPDQHF